MQPCTYRLIPPKYEKIGIVEKHPEEYKTTLWLAKVPEKSHIVRKNIVNNTKVKFSNDSIEWVYPSQLSSDKLRRVVREHRGLLSFTLKEDGGQQCWRIEYLKKPWLQLDEGELPPLKLRDAIEPSLSERCPWVHGLCSELNSLEKNLSDELLSQGETAFYSLQQRLLFPMLDNYIFHTKKGSALLLHGSSNKTKRVFAQQYIRRRLLNWREGDAIPFYIPLTLIRDPKDLMRESLALYGLEKQMEALKLKQLVFIMDGYGDMVDKWGKGFIKIFKENSLGEWPWAHFIFTLRERVDRSYVDIFTDYETKKKYFRMSEIKVKSLYRLLQGEEERLASGGWSMKQLEGALKGLGLNSEYIKMDDIALLMSLLPQVGNAVDGAGLSGIERLDAWAAALLRRVSTSGSLDAGAYLQQLCQIAKDMEICGLHSVRERILEDERPMAEKVNEQIVGIEMGIISLKEELQETYTKENSEQEEKELKESINRDEEKIRDIKESFLRLQESFFGAKALHVEGLFGGGSFVTPLVANYFLLLSADEERQKQIANL